MLVPPKAPNNCQWSTCNPTNTKHENRRDMIYLSSACRRCKCYLPQPKPWSYHCGWEEQPFPHDRNIAKQKTGWHKESGRMEATATGTTTHIGGNIYIFFQKWGGRQTYWMLSRQRRENSVHSTFSTTKEWKRGGGLCRWTSLDVNDDHYITSFHSFLVASLLCDVTQDFCRHMKERYRVGSVESH